MKILLLDIETAPNLAYVWGLWKQNVAINQIESSGYVLCWAAKWYGTEEVIFDSMKKSLRPAMLRHIHKLLHEADVVVHYNGDKFDIPTLNKEFIKYKMSPPSPYKNVDLLKACRRLFRFESNKLDYVLQTLSLGNKVKHEGFELWTKCMAGDEEAWKNMETYNKGDVTGLEKLYKRLLPWLTTHPNRSVYDEVACCPNCGSTHYNSRGIVVTRAYKYRRFQCTDCGHWFRGRNNIANLPPQMRQIAG